MKSNGGFQDFDEFGRNATDRKKISGEYKQARKIRNNANHIALSFLGVSRTKDGNKLGLRKRQLVNK